MKQNNDRPVIVAIAGNIGTGKSFAMKHFMENGIPCHSADKIANDIIISPDSRDELVMLFGEQIIKKNKVDKKELRKLVFADQERLETLNHFVHHKILSVLQDIIDNYCIDNKKHEVVCFEIPLLFELKLYHSFDLNILLYSDKKAIFDRITKRDNCSENEVKEILKFQITHKKNKKYADIILDNNDDIKSFTDRLNILLQTFKYIKKRKLKRLAE